MLQEHSVTRHQPLIWLIAFTLAACSQRAANQPDERAVRGDAVRPPSAELMELEGQDVYLSCNMAFDAHREAYDANYLYSGSSNLLRFGTRVRVTKVHWHKNADLYDVTLQPEGLELTYRITYKYGIKRMTSSDYFHGILRNTDPRKTLEGVPREVVDAVTEGRLIPGLTKEQALMARGYPPLHRTAGIESDEWVYYDSRSLVNVVRFENGKITSVEPGRPH